MRSTIAMILLVGCGSDTALVAERDQFYNEAMELEEKNGRLELEADTLHAQVQQLKTQLKRARREVVFAQLGVTEEQPLVAQLETSLGTIRCTLWPRVAPYTVQNFVELAEGTKSFTDPRTGEAVQRPYYDGTIFHRVMPEFMIQGGDPLGSGRGGPGYTFEDELDPGVTFDRPGLLAMANPGRTDSNGSQFFITDRATPTRLNNKHTIFGECQNQDVVEAIATVPRDERNNRPEEDVVLSRVVIKRGG
jgi:cyclophilin family peptidyl-prolyl cis-trans isomerase